MESARFQKIVILILVVLAVVYWEFSRKQARQFLDRPIEPLVVSSPNAGLLAQLNWNSLVELATNSPLKDIDGKPVTAAELKLPLENGGRILLNFWASWCPPCVEEWPSLLKFARTKASSLGITVVTVSYDEDLSALKSGFQKMNLGSLAKARATGALRMYFDHGQRLAKAFGTTKFPESFLIDAKGNVVGKFIGAQNWMDEKLFSDPSNK